MLALRLPEYEFGEALARVVSPSHPIDSIENLFGREEELDRIRKAFFAPGRHVFIFGERGVGKSSLAATAAHQLQSSDNSYIDVSCCPESTLSSIMAAIAGQALGTSQFRKSELRRRISLGASWLNYSVERLESGHEELPDVKSVSHAVEILRELSELHSNTTAMVVDEVDRIASDIELEKLSDLIKQLGDKRVPIRIIFTGVGESLDEILGRHASAFRQLETIELPRLSWDGRWNIAISALNRFGVKIDRSIYIRIAAVSDGFPYYVHLVVEKLLWILFEADSVKSEVTWDDYMTAVDHAIAGIAAELARPYKCAVLQRARHYELVVWATAADEWQGASLNEMFQQYQKIIEQIADSDDSEALSYSKFCSRVRNLQREDFGSILRKGDKPGYYHYTEKMLRGYVRLQAEAHGVLIRGKDPVPSHREFMKVPARTRGYHSSHPPKGIGLK